MTIRLTSRRTSRGTTGVCTAAFDSIALLFMFGFVEYARFVCFLQVADNAVREACRFATAHTNDGTIVGNLNDTPTFDASDANYTGEFKPGAGYTSIRAVVNYQMGTLKNAITSYNV